MMIKNKLMNNNIINKILNLSILINPKVNILNFLRIFDNHENTLK